MSPSLKQKCRILPAKDLRQYRVEYRNVMSHMVGNTWVLGSKSIDIANLTLKKILKKIIFFFIFLIILKYII